MSPETESPEKSTNRQSNSVRRACDCCRKRKVKCDGESPCGPCRKATIRCAYLQPPKKKGPKGLRSAQVLRALRDIDEAAPAHLEGPLSPTPHPNGYRQWSLSSGSSPVSGPGMDNEYATNAASASSTPGYGYYPTGAHSYPQPLPTDPSLLADAYAFNGAWGAPAAYVQRSIQTDSQPILPRVPNTRFHPYAQLFFNHLFAIMPVIDPKIYLDHRLYDQSHNLAPETYSFLASLSAATIVQLESSVPLPPHDPLPGRAASEAEMFSEECLRTRRQYDYLRNPSTLTVMTSFFLFAYYGNKEGERSERAWHYLQESITFAELLDLDDERVITKVDTVEAQWRRRLFWLLFITERYAMHATNQSLQADKSRAYAIQRRKNTRLHATIELPLVFESEDPRLLNGFVNLIHLFSAIDDTFVVIWRGTRRRSLCSTPWLADTQRSLDTVALSLGDITETQHLDIAVSREWLHVLGWQMGVGNGLIWGKGEGGMRLEYPIELSRRVVRIIEGASPLAIDSHGIGMEQKLSDIGGCLADVLRCSAGDASDTFLQGRQYLHLLVTKVSPHPQVYSLPVCLLHG